MFKSIGQFLMLGGIVLGVPFYMSMSGVNSGSVLALLMPLLIVLFIPLAIVGYLFIFIGHLLTLV